MFISFVLRCDHYRAGHSHLCGAQGVPKRIKGGFFVREPLGHIAAPGLGSRHPTRAGGVPCDPAPPACPERRVTTTGRSLPHRVSAEVASISSPRSSLAQSSPPATPGVGTTWLRVTL